MGGGGGDGEPVLRLSADFLDSAAPVTRFSSKSCSASPEMKCHVHSLAPTLDSTKLPGC